MYSIRVFIRDKYGPIGLCAHAARLELGIALEMVSSTADGVSTDALLNLQWQANSLPMLFPVHLYARPCGESFFCYDLRAFWS